MRRRSTFLLARLLAAGSAESSGVEGLGAFGRVLYEAMMARSLGACRLEVYLRLPSPTTRALMQQLFLRYSQRWATAVRSKFPWPTHAKKN